MNVRQVFLKVLIGSTVLSAVIGIAVVLIGDFGNFEVRVLMTTLTVTITSILGLACGAYYETGRGRILPIAGIGLAVAAALMTFLIIWNVADNSEIFIKSAVTVTLLALACSHLSLLSLARLERRFSWLRIAGFLTVTLLSAILVVLIWTEPDSLSGLVSRTIGVLSILVAAVTVMTPIAHKLSASETGLAEIDDEIARLRARISELEGRRAEMSSVRDAT